MDGDGHTTYTRQLIRYIGARITILTVLNCYWVDVIPRISGARA